MMKTLEEKNLGKDGEKTRKGEVMYFNKMSENKFKIKRQRGSLAANST